jgi:Uma2 family endonuclease
MDMNGMVVNLKPITATEEQFYELCKLNPELRLERTSAGEVLVMPPAGLESSARNSSLTRQLGNWNVETKLGIAFDSSGGYTLPNGAIRAPDASWVAWERWQRLPRQERIRFAHIVPDFVVELTSPSDRLEDAREKMAEYIANGTRLGWLIDLETQRVEIYRPGVPPQLLENLISLSAEPELPGFVLDLREIFAEI